jgi:hypothetical protein
LEDEKFIGIWKDREEMKDNPDGITCQGKKQA